MRSRRLSLVSPLAFIAALSAMAALSAQPAAPAGAATPQEAVAVLKKATDAGDFLGTLPVISPAGLKQIATEGVSGVVIVLAFSDPDDAMPGAPTPPKAELDQKRKQYKEAVGMATAVLKPYGLDGLIGKPILSPDTQATLEAALEKTDNRALVQSLYNSLVKMGPLLGMDEPPRPDPMVKIGTVSDYAITGDTATARNDANMLNFTRINGRWFIEPPSESGAMMNAGSASATEPDAASGQGMQRAASGKDPEIVVGGIQVARVAAANDDFSARPFNSENGTKIVLWVKMPAGQGLIEIDEDTSVLSHFGDDKGSNLGGRFDSFPDEFKDASGGTIEIESSGLPAAGATALIAEGSLSLNIADSTKKTRVANVGVKNEATFKFGETTITFSEVESDGETLRFTFNLPRTVMEGIKNVVFLDAKGQPLESDTAGSGYMNNAAEMGFRVTTASSTVTIEFEAWEGRRNIKVPFSVKAVIGMN